MLTDLPSLSWRVSQSDTTRTILTRRPCLAWLGAGTRASSWPRRASGASCYSPSAAVGATIVPISGASAPRRHAPSKGIWALGLVTWGTLRRTFKRAGLSRRCAMQCPAVARFSHVAGLPAACLEHGICSGINHHGVEVVTKAIAVAGTPSAT